MRVCGLKDDGLVKRICGRHFKADDYLPEPNQALLQPQAIPSLHLPELSSQEVNFEGAKIVTEDHLNEMFKSRGGIDSRRLHYDCAVPGCTSSNNTHELLSSDPRGKPDPRRKLWIQACQIKNADERGGRLLVCSKHFRRDDFNPVTRKLHSFAVPSLFLPTAPVRTSEEQPIHDATEESSEKDPLDTSNLDANKKVRPTSSNDPLSKAGVNMDLEQIKAKLKKQFEEAKLAKMAKLKRGPYQQRRVIGEQVLRDGVKTSTSKCSECPGHFRNKQELNFHLKRAHAAHAQTYSCHICQMTFPIYSRLEMHLNAHSGT